MTVAQLVAELSKIKNQQLPICAYLHPEDDGSELVVSVIYDELPDSEFFGQPLYCAINGVNSGKEKE